MAVIGPLTVHPTAEGSGIGRMLIECTLAQANKQNHDQIRLVQITKSHSFLCLVYKVWFHSSRAFISDAREANKKGRVIKQATLIYALFEQKRIFLHAMSFRRSVHGFSREMELRQAKDQGVAIMIERDSAPTGYAAGIIHLIMQLQSQTKRMQILIANASVIRGPGFLVPARNYELLYWLLENGFQIWWPANLMTIGNYQEPSTPFLPSLAY